MTFREFLGNREPVLHLRESLAAGRLPHSLLLSGPRGVGKYSLAIALAQTMQCLDLQTVGRLPDACGRCANCTRIAAAVDLEARTAEAVEAREELRETDRKETRVLLQPHPDVMIVPPDPPQNLVKVGQIRAVINSAQRAPLEGRAKIYIFPAAVFMTEAANSLLKILEEPPEYAHILLLAENPSSLLPTIRSRCAHVRLHPMPLPELEAILAERRLDWKPDRRELAARLAEGAVGRALGLAMDTYLASRSDVLVLLRGASAEPDASTLFRVTESYRAGAEGQQKTVDLLRALYSLLEDILLLQNGRLQSIRNVDITPELRRLAQAVSLEWVDRAAHRIADVESGMRRNLLRSLSLDALAAGLTRR